MALGKIKRVDNADARFGADPWYWFLKVQVPGRAERFEEYWLVTEEEANKFSARAAKNPEDAPTRRRGVFTRVANTDPAFGANDFYHAVNVEPGGVWMLTDFDLERIRVRVAKNQADINANRESWLADLLD